MDPGFLLIITALILSVIIHEVAHGYMANWLGDPTARLAGRLTLNPIPHIDPVGSILIPVLLALSSAGLLFGWAKPVPYNPYNIRNQRWGEALVAFAGPGVNLLIAGVFALLIRSGLPFGFAPSFIELAVHIVYINILLAFFNLIPLPPLDGSKVLASLLPLKLQLRYRELGAQIESYGAVATFGFLLVFVYILWAPFSVLVSAAFRLLVGFNF